MSAPSSLSTLSSAIILDLVTSLKASLTSKPKKSRKRRCKSISGNGKFMDSLLALESHLVKKILEDHRSNNHSKNDDLDKTLESLYALLTKISTYDRSYLLYVRNHSKSGDRTIFDAEDLLFECPQDNKLCVPILRYFCSLTRSTLNCTTLLNRGRIFTVLFQLLGCHQRPSQICLLSYELMASLCRAKKGIALLLSNQFNIVKLSDYLFNLSLEMKAHRRTHSRSYEKYVRICYAMLGVFLHIACLKKGREALNKVNIVLTISGLMEGLVTRSTKTSKNSNHLMDRVFIMCSLVIQRCLPPLKLPIDDILNPFNFILQSNQHENTAPQKVEAGDGDDESSIAGDDDSESENEGNEVLYSSTSSEDEADHVVDTHTDSEKKTPIKRKSCDLFDLDKFKEFFPEIRDLDLEFSNTEDESEDEDESYKSPKRKPSLSKLISCTKQSPTSSPVGESFLSTYNANSLQGGLRQDSHHSSSNSKADQEDMEPIDFEAVYASFHDGIRSTIPRKKIAAPAALDSPGSLIQEPLQSVAHHMGLWRRKLLDHVKERILAVQRGVKEDQDQIVYDITKPELKTSDGNLRFESRFESGNLRLALQSTSKSRPNEYNLLLNPDINSEAHVHWFFFEVSNVSSNVEYVFNIINCEKQSSLYNEGMQPLIYSCKKSQQTGRSYWFRGGQSIAYYRNHYVEGSNSLSKNVADAKALYTLTFTVQFPHDSDTCYLAYNYPYTYSLLRTHIHFWLNSISTQAEQYSSPQKYHNHHVGSGDENSDSPTSPSPSSRHRHHHHHHPHNDIYFKCESLCETISGNQVPLITITSKKHPEDSHHHPYFSHNQEPRPKRRERGASVSLDGNGDIIEGSSKKNIPYIVLTGRVHPGESNASWVLKGCIDHLLSSRPSAQRLRESAIFKIIPMLNPDGVINGSSRTSLSGDDLNRQWKNPDPAKHPTIYHAKKLIEYIHRLTNRKSPVLYCDFHGHSRRKNIFLYGCSGRLSWCRSDRIFRSSDEYSAAVLPAILHQIAPAFSYSKTSFEVEKNRETTARVTLWRELNLKLSYTMEASQAGCDEGPYMDLHLNINHLREMGAKFCQGIASLKMVKDVEGEKLVPLPDEDALDLITAGLDAPMESDSDESSEEIDDDQSSYSK